ncbi:hypothetical protein B7463_g8639, partial [Scytalidium lignicola]
MAMQQENQLTDAKDSALLYNLFSQNNSLKGMDLDQKLFDELYQVTGALLDRQYDSLEKITVTLKQMNCKFTGSNPAASHSYTEVDPELDGAYTQVPAADPGESDLPDQQTLLDTPNMIPMIHTCPHNCTDNCIISIQLGQGQHGRPVVFRDVLGAFCRSDEPGITELDRYRFDELGAALQHQGKTQAIFRFNQGRDRLRYIDRNGTTRYCGNQRQFRVSLTDMYYHQGMRVLEYYLERGTASKRQRQESSEGTTATPSSAKEPQALPMRSRSSSGTETEKQTSPSNSANKHPRVDDCMEE